MLKIVAAFDGLNFSLSTQQYAIDLAKKLEAFLTIVFLDDKTYTSYKIYDFVLADGVSESKLKQAQKEAYELIDTVNALKDTVNTLAPVLQEGKKLMGIFENLKL